MSSKRLLLLNTLFKSTSSINTVRYSSDRKKKKKAVGAIFAQLLVAIMIVAYTVLVSAGMCLSGAASSLPGMAASLICLMSFFLTLFKANGYMFAFKEYDMLMSMPFPVKTIVADKFMYMYVKGLSWVMAVSVSVLATYAYFVRPGIANYIVWIVLSLMVPLVPIVAATFIGAFVAKIGSGFKYKKIVQSVLIFIVVIPMFFLQYIIEDIVEDNKVSAIAGTVSGAIDTGAGIYLPVKWFSEAVTDLKISSILLFVGVSIVVFEAFVSIVAKYYRNINSRLMSSAKSSSKTGLAYKKRSVVASVAYKELKALLGSTNYSVNAGLGLVIPVILAIVALVMGGENIVSVVTKGAPVDPAVVVPALSLLVYFFTGMVATTAISPSIEGKNFWILKTLPIDNMTIFKGKMLFNLLLYGPVGMITVLCLCIAFNAGLLMTVLNLLLFAGLMIFSTEYGLICGVKHIKLEWENDIEVIKQGSAVALYIFPNMIMAMLLTGGAIALGIFLGEMPAVLIVTAFMVLLSVLCASVIKSLSKKSIQ